MASTTITIEKNNELIDDLSTIEKVETTAITEHPSTLPLSSDNNSYATARRLVLTTSSLDENQKVRKKNQIFFFRSSFLFLVSTSFIYQSF